MLKMPSIRKSKHREERALLDYLDMIRPHSERGWAFHFHLSKLGAQSRGENLLYALGQLRSLAEGLLGRLFLLGNSDLVVVCKVARIVAVKEEIRRIQYLFRDDPLFQLGALSNADFCSIYNLNEGLAEFVDAVRSLADEVAAVNSPTGGPCGPAPVGGEGATLDLAQLGAVSGKLAAADLSGAVRHQPVYAVADDMTLTPLFHELFISIADLERIVAPGLRLAADRWLFLHLTKLLDRQMLTLLTGKDGAATGVGLAAEALQSRFVRSGKFSLNLNVSTVLSPEFQAFEAVLDDAARRSVVLEFQKIDVFADLGSFLFVRDLVHQRGYRVCLDGLSQLSLPFIDREALGIDLVKLYWSATAAQEASSAERAILRQKIERSGVDRVILCRCDSDDAIAWGRGLGLSNFQGLRLDAIAAERAGPTAVGSGLAAGGSSA